MTLKAHFLLFLVTVLPELDMHVFEQSDYWDTVTYPVSYSDTVVCNLP